MPSQVGLVLDWSAIALRHEVMPKGPLRTATTTHYAELLNYAGVPNDRLHEVYAETMKNRKGSTFALSVTELLGTWERLRRFEKPASQPVPNAFDEEAADEAAKAWVESLPQAEFDEHFQRIQDVAITKYGIKKDQWDSETWQAHVTAILQAEFVSEMKRRHDSE